MMRRMSGSGVSETFVQAHSWQGTSTFRSCHVVSLDTFELFKAKKQIEQSFDKLFLNL
jgi:hypothetical protein